MNSYNDFTDISHDWADKTFTDRLDLSGNSINVLSCFDGLSGGQLALEKSGIKVDKYFASEIDKYAIAVAKYNYPNMIHLGDVKKIDTSTLPKIDLMLAGSPCTDLSFAGLGKGLVEGEQSSLFFDWWRLVQELKPKYIFLENVRMKEEYKTQISDILGFEPTAINSSLVSAQNRYRLYWFGIRDGDTYKAIPISQPEDRGIVLADILEQGLDDSWTLSDQAQDRARNNPRSRAFTPEQEKSGALLSNQYKQSTDSLYAVADGCIQVGETAEIKGYDIIKRVYSPEGKAPTLTTMQGGHREPKVATTDPKGGRIVNRRKVDGVRKDNQLDLPLKPYLEVRADDKTNCISTVQKDNVVVSQIRDKSKAVRVGGRGSYDRHEWDSVDELHWRKLTPKECARLQTVPDNHCIMGSFDGVVKPISKSQQYKMLGNGWTIDVIAHILEGMKDV
jgi:DNA (cytosine-5)-methyltransferase 3A